MDTLLELRKRTVAELREHPALKGKARPTTRTKKNDLIWEILVRTAQKETG